MKYDICKQDERKRDEQEREGEEKNETKTEFCGTWPNFIKKTFLEAIPFHKRILFFSNELK